MTFLLNTVPYPNWQKFYDKIISDPYIALKYNRQKRLLEKEQYIDLYCNELYNSKNEIVFDLGPGPGEFMEIVREIGHVPFGFDAPENDCEMGNEYLQLSKLMTCRQKLNVIYDDFNISFMNNKFDIKQNSVFFINSQGSIEQIFKQCLEGPPHIKTKNANLLSWKICRETKETLFNFLNQCYKYLKIGGTLLIYGNGAINVSDYDLLIRICINEINGFSLIERYNDRFHKMRKIL
ncbi:MAG: hypothetical protein WC934_11630 [Acidithiobacillus sp.]|jgi:hypothetical protein|uniref:hypothetical protein n=1 Tax=Acidithiobacillus sp. TaxID=1872118 RepID=UPI003560C623